MMQESKSRFSAVAFCLASVAVVACAGEVEDPGFTHVIASSEVVRFAADESLEQIQDVAVAVSGEIWALQRTLEPHLFVYDEDGELQSSFGTTGAQNNQLRNPYSLLPTENARAPMTVWDAGNRRVSTFTSNGRGTVVQIDRSRGQVYAEIESHSYGKPLEMARFGDGYLLLDHSNGLHVTTDYLRSELLVLGPGGLILDTLVDFEREFADSIQALRRDVNYLTPTPQWVVCVSGEVAVLDPFTRTVRWYGVDGTEAGTDSIPIEVRAVTEEDQDAFLYRRFALQWRETQAGEPDSTILANSVDDFKVRHWDQFSDNAPPAVGMMCAGDRELWLQEFSTADHPLGFGNRWLVHSPGSVDRIYVQFPSEFRPKKIIDRKVYGVATAEDGGETVAYVSLPNQISPPAEGAH